MNVEKYLEQCLESIRVQTLGDFEVICLDDGSTDGSPAIIDAYCARDSRFRAVHKANSGYGDSMNLGLALARGRYIAIVESDDFIDPPMFERLVNTAQNYNAQVVKSDFYLYWSGDAGAKNQPPAGATAAATAPAEKNLEAAAAPAAAAAKASQPNALLSSTGGKRESGVNVRFGWVTPELAGVMNPQCDREVFFLKPSIWSALYRRDFLLAHDISFLPSPGASYQDAGFNFKVWASATRVVLLDEAYLHYRQDNEASSVNSPAKLYCVCDEYAGMLSWLDAHPELPSWLRSVVCRMRYDVYLWNYDRLAPELRESWLARMREDFAAEDASGYASPLYFVAGTWQYRQLIQDDPEAFTVMQSLIVHPPASKQETAQRYLDAGGPALLARVLAYKLKTPLS
jgi:glycosyltransferase involved in cell wall biosynthesis